MDIERAVEKYLVAIRSDIFAEYEKEFAQKITSALAKGYLQNSHETPLVQIVEDVVNNVDNLNRKDHFELSTRSIFIHGNKSQVKFDCYGQSVPSIELGDLIFIISVVFDNKKYFEKFTINQFKRDKRNTKSISWSIGNRKQLYLLSRFPTFRGVKGLIPKKDFNLPNYSGCLGSYGLLYNPGDFAFVSATGLDSFIGHKKTLKKKELYHLTEKYLFPYFPYFYPDIDELLSLSSEFKRYLSWNLFGNYHRAYNVFDFAHKYLRVGIGEPIFMKIGIYNSLAKNFLHELFSAVKIKARRERDILKFIDGFFRYDYASSEGEGSFRGNIEFDFEGGGIGIIHTIINLGE